MPLYWKQEPRFIWQVQTSPNLGQNPARPELFQLGASSVVKLDFKLVKLDFKLYFGYSAAISGIFLLCINHFLPIDLRRRWISASPETALIRRWDGDLFLFWLVVCWKMVIFSSPGFTPSMTWSVNSWNSTMMRRERVENPWAGAGKVKNGIKINRRWGYTMTTERGLCQFLSPLGLTRGLSHNCRSYLKDDGYQKTLCVINESLLPTWMMV